MNLFLTSFLSYYYYKHMVDLKKIWWGSENYKLFIIVVTFISTNLFNYSAEEGYKPEWPKIEVMSKDITLDNINKLLNAVPDKSVEERYDRKLKTTVEDEISVVEGEIKNEVNKLIDTYKDRISGNKEYTLKKGVFNNLIEVFSDKYESIKPENVANVKKLVFLTIYLITMHNTWIDGKDYYSIPSGNIEFISSFYEVDGRKKKLRDISDSTYSNQYSNLRITFADNYSISVIRSLIEGKRKLPDVFSGYVKNYLEKDILKILENYDKDTLAGVQCPAIYNGFSYRLSNDGKSVLGVFLKEKFDYELLKAGEKINKKISEKKLEIENLRKVYNEFDTSLKGIGTKCTVIMSYVDNVKKVLVSHEKRLNKI